MMPLDLVTKWIDEHGSANITRDNLAFLRDQIEAIEKENVKARDRERELEDQVSKLSEQLLQATEEKDQYAQQLADCQQRVQQEAKKQYRLDEEQKSVLRRFAAAGRNLLELDSRNHVVVSLVGHKFLAPVSWMGYRKGLVPLQLTPKGQTVVAELENETQN